MRPDTFQILADHIRLFPDLQPAGPGRREPVSVEKQLLMTLWYVGGNDVVRRIADRFWSVGINHGRMSRQNYLRFVEVKRKTDPMAKTTGIATRSSRVRT